MSVVKVIHVVGAGRSGSTILDIILADQAKSLGVGELCNFATVWKNDEYCACGERMRDCSFWSDIHAAFLGNAGGENSLSQFAEVQAKEERFRRTPLIFWDRVTGTQRSREYNRYAATLYRTLAERSGAKVIVDSSKNPVRALALSPKQLKEEGVDIQFLHLIRDGRGVAYSLAREHKKNVEMGVQKDFAARPVLSTALRWFIANAYAEIVSLMAPRSRRLFYEDFLRDPTSALIQLGEWVSLDYSEVSRKLREGEPIESTHTMAGNRVRLTGPVKLKPVDTWAAHLPPKERRKFSIVTAPLLFAYGYFGDRAFAA